MSDEREFRPPASAWVRTQLETIDEAGDTGAVDIQGRPVVVLTILGARSGLWRRVPLMRVEHGGTYAVVASDGGAPKHPAWYHNLIANPDIELQDGTETSAVRARTLAGEERRRWWDVCVAAFPPYADYQTKTDREIPVLILEPRA
jgi:deazaflavin-dependent oxidoreductase (nitroreductase family)